MARPLRIEYPGAWYHVTSRGNERGVIYRDDHDRWKWLITLAECCRDFAVEVHAYVMMANHFHLLLRTLTGNLSRFMQCLNTTHTVYFNRRWERVGHLFQGRYKAIVVDADDYLKALSAYIHLNPVCTKDLENASIEEKIRMLDAYGWSSFRAYMGKEKAPEFLVCGPVLAVFGARLREARRTYRNFVMQRLVEKTKSPFDDQKAGLVLGGPAFVEWVYEKFVAPRPEDRELTRLPELRPCHNLSEVVKAVAAEFGAKPEDITKWRSPHVDAKLLLIHLCYRYALRGSPLRQIGEALGGIGVSGMEKGRKRFQVHLERDKRLAMHLVKVEEALSPRTRESVAEV